MASAHPHPQLRPSLAAFVLTHVVALGTMALLLRPGVDATIPAGVRTAWIAANPTTWRLGWLPWQLSAVSDIWVCMAIILWARSASETHGKRHTAAFAGWLGAAFCAVALIPEQWCEFQFVSSFVDTARQDPSRAEATYKVYAIITGVWANAGYTLMTACWMRAVAELRGAPLMPKGVEYALLGAFMLSSTSTLGALLGCEPQSLWLVGSAAVTGVAFVGLLAWTALLYRRVGQPT